VTRDVSGPVACDAGFAGDLFTQFSALGAIAVALLTAQPGTNSVGARLRSGRASILQESQGLVF
jgi:hypothetical protein